MSSSSSTPPDTIMVSDSPVEKGSHGVSPTTDAPNSGNTTVPKPKRLACTICRKRKLKCDGIRPSCSTCSRLGHSCAYDEIRRKSGPKRGYVKALEERLKQVETLLKTQDPATATVNPEATRSPPIIVDNASKPPTHPALPPDFAVHDPAIAIASNRDMDRWHFNSESPQNVVLDDFNFNNNMNNINNNVAMNMGNVETNVTWEMIGLGLEEPLPPQETIDELHQIYFEKIHPSLPMIHKYRYLAAMNLAPNQRPPVALRYAMWTMASSVTDKFEGLKDLFYQRARKYIESDYMKGYGEHVISIAHAQTHVLLASYEFKMMYFPRAWMSTGSAVRLCQMVGLHRLDGSGLDVKQCLPPPRDWTEKEERRRTFWMAFCEDRYASIGTGWPMTVEEKDILTDLPCSEEAFEMSRPEQSMSLTDAMTPAGASKLSPFGGIVLMACLFGRNLIHLHRPDADDRDHDLNGEFWKRHRNLDNVLLNTSLCLPSSLKLPAGLGSPNVVFTNMCIHTSTICLHQAAIFKADKNRLPSSVSSESKVRCITAANEIASIMRMISHLDLAAMNAFISFCLYVAARVFVQYLKSRPEDSQTGDSLRFLLAAMNALKRRNPLTESFLVQLDVDLEALGVRIPKLKTAFPRSSDSPGPKNHMPHIPNMRPASQPAHTSQRPAASGPSQLTDPPGGCNYMRAAGDNGNPMDGPEIIELDRTPGSVDHGVQPWFSGTDPIATTGVGSTSLPTRDRGHGSSYIPLHGFMHTGANLSTYNDMDTGSSSNQDMSGASPDGGPSNRPTPNSSAASDHLGRGSTNSNNNNNLSTSQVEAMGGVGVSFFGAPSTQFSLSGTGLTPDQRFSMPETPGANSGSGTGPSGVPGGGYGMPPHWADLGHGSADMTPVAEGVLRSIMAMGPLETMDLGWEAEH